MCASAINLPAASSMETPLLRPKLASKPANTLPSPTRNHDEDDDEHQVGLIEKGVKSGIQSISRNLTEPL